MLGAVTFFNVSTFNDSISFKNAEYVHFIDGSSASCALSFASEVALVHLDFTTLEAQSHQRHVPG